MEIFINGIANMALLKNIIKCGSYLGEFDQVPGKLSPKPEVTMHKIIRLITWFDKQSEDFKGQLELGEIPVEELQTLFGESSENLMYDCYPITPKNASFFQELAQQDLRFDVYNYFLECEEDTN